MSSPWFLSVDGIDGAGKSTQLDLLTPWLRKQGLDVVTCRDPGSTALGESVRKILLDRGDVEIHRLSEMLLYMAARAQLVEEVIRPALEAGKTVLSDRFVLANIAYQGYGGKLDIEEVRKVSRVATGQLLPDLTITLDLDVETMASRLTGPTDYMERQGAEFFHRVRQGFLTESAKDPDRLFVVDASRSVEEIHKTICEIVASKLQLSGPSS